MRLLGLWFTAEDQWAAAAVGDACLFQVRNGTTRRAFPIRRSAEFGNRPTLVASRAQRGKRTRRLLLQGDWQPDDLVLLMTDALAQWFLQQSEEGERPWEELLVPRSKSEFKRWLEALRAEGKIRNDDVALVLISSSDTEKGATIADRRSRPEKKP